MRRERATELSWSRAHRVTSWRARPEAFFETVADPADLADVLAVLAHGAPAVIDPATAAAGPGAGWVMLPFLRHGESRFSDGRSYGVFYAGGARETAFRETMFHYARFLAASAEPPTLLGVQLLRCRIRATMVDIRGQQARRPELYDPDPALYGPAQRWAAALQGAGRHGIVYDSVRHAGGECVAVFTPRSVSRCVVAGYFAYDWDGSSIVRVVAMRDVLRP